MKLKPFPIIISRTPAYNLDSNLSNIWEDLKEKIRESSPIFYELIKNEESQNLLNLPEKTFFTIWKYFNRAKYRATPFASFAAISTLPLARNIMPPVIQNHIVKHHFIDWGKKEEYISQKINPKTIILTNSSVYKLGNELRYLKFADGHFALAEVNPFPEIEFILERCKYKTTLASIYSAMELEFDLPKKSTRDLVKQMIYLQLIITNNAPNITGTDYFRRINIQKPKEPTDYIIAERKIKSGGLNEDGLQKVPLLISFLHKNLESFAIHDLKAFKAAFTKKFENRIVSLAVAMDPEAGVGYGNLEHTKEDDDLIAALKSNHGKKNLPKDIKYTKFHAFLLDQLGAKTKIQLEDFKIDNGETEQKLPNTFSLMFHFFEGRPVVESLGGSTATALLGRFTLANEDITSLAKQIVETEAEANPNICFFDIAYQVENHIDNVNRRKQIYPYELPVLTYSEGDNLLNFDDILVSVQRDEIVLTSKKLGKRLIPRIPSAYNYSRSDLAAYRFLCDVQNQHLTTNLNFELKQVFGGLNFYPRVCYENIILSPASWLLPNHFHQKKNIPLQERLSSLKDWLNSHHIDFLFKTGISDHTLCFDSSLDTDLRLFLCYCNQYTQNELYITEALIDTTDGIRDEKGQIYSSQYIVNYYHKERIYAPTSGQAQVSKTLTKTDIKLPGEDWLYFDIYAHSSRSNLILLKEIKAYINENEKSLVKWFFIRYTDPAAHLRLRLQLTEDAPGYTIMHSLMNIIKPLLLQGLVTDFSIRTYYRETQRYGDERMDLVESFFHQDSEYILLLLAKAKENDQLYAQTLLLFMKYISLSIPDINDQLTFTKQVAKAFSEEMDIEPDNFKKINVSYNKLKKNIRLLATPLPKQLLKIHERMFKKVISNCKSSLEKERMLADLFHMHVNRLFKADQRMHEAIIYQYLLQLLRTQKSLSEYK